MNKAALKQKMGHDFLLSIGYATFRASWTAATIVAGGTLLIGGEGLDFVTTILIVGTIASLFVASFHSVVVLGFLTMSYRSKIQTDTAGMLFGRWWLIHSFTVWMIPAILMVINQVEEIEAWGFLIGIAINSTVVLWLFCKRYIAKRDIAISELRKKDREAAIANIVPS